MVVIAIISLLVSILVPSLSKAKELARRTVCSTNLKNFGPAFYMYADDHDGFLPPSNSSSAMRDYWSHDLVEELSEKYLGGYKQGMSRHDGVARYPRVFVCPSGENIDPELPAWGQGLYMYYSHLSSSPGSHFFNANGSVNGGYRFEPPGRVDQAASEHTTKSGVKLPFTSKIMSDRMSWNVSNNTWHLNHTGAGSASDDDIFNNSGGNVLFLDGHVEWILLPDADRVHVIPQAIQYF